MFRELGAGIIDTDEISRNLVAPGSPALESIVAAFGAGILAADGTLDRRRLREIVFADNGERRRLEAILHPRIREAALARAASSEAPYVIFVVPLLFETGFDELVDSTLVVDCPERLQIMRLVERDRVSENDARSVIGAQLGREDRLAHADAVIDSSTSLDATREAVRALHEAFMERAQNCPDEEGRAE